MNPCQNCGRINAAEAIYCRFCGTKFNGQAERPDPFGHSAPRPYAWKTDEFQASTVDKGTTQFQPRQASTSAFTPAAPMAFRQAQYMGDFRCPRCGSTLPPVFERRVSTAGWIVFSVLLVLTVVFFWIGLLIREDVAVCPNCRLSLAYR